MPPNPQNLKPFKKGQSGNPKGRPKMPDIREALVKILAEEKDGYTALDAILAQLRAKAAKGDIKAAEVLLDRAYGKARQTIDGNISVRKLEEMTDAELEAIAAGRPLDD